MNIPYGNLVLMAETGETGMYRLDHEHALSMALYHAAAWPDFWTYPEVSE